MKKIVLIVSILINTNAVAKNGSITDLELPRFVSLKSDQVNLRIGPSINYPILIKYIKKNLPVEITDEFDVWRKIKDHDNNIGWIHKSLIKGERFIYINKKGKKNKQIFDRPNGKIIGLMQINNIIKLKKCLLNWCYITHEELEGWISKKDIWGVYPKEVYNLSFLQPFINQYWKISEHRWFKNY